MRILKATIFIIYFSTHSFAQDTTRSSTQDVIENIVNDATDEQDLLPLVEEFEYLHEHPINLLKPNYNDLIKLPFVSPLLAEAIVLYTDTVQISVLDQLMNVSLMTEEIYKKILPFVILEVQEKQSMISLLTPNQFESRTRYEKRLQTVEGFANHSFRGEAYSTYQRLRAGNEKNEAAGLFEKDAGELYQDGLTAGYISLTDVGLFSSLIVGNFNISSGQGLLFAKNISTSKGTDAVGQVRKRGSSLSPSISTDEYRYFQGGAATLALSNFSLLGFYSKRKLPASFDTLGFATSFFTTGLYRTDNDLKRKNTLKEAVIGGKLTYSIDLLKSISFNFVNAQYGNLLRSSLYDLQNKKNLKGGSVAVELPFSTVNIFGEIASNAGRQFSKVIGVSIPLSSQFDVSYHHRAYSKGYVSPFARPFGERDNISDGELGNYVGTEIKIHRFIINSYIDNYFLPSTTTGFGLTGREVFSHVLYSGIKNVDLTFQLRNKTKSQDAIRELDDKRIQTNYRMAYKFRVSRYFSLAQRFEVVNVSYNPSDYREKGYLTFVEGIWKERNIGVDVKARMVFFDTDSYDSRLYQYESDVAGNFSNPPMYGKGIRWYVITGYEMFSDFKLSLKYSETKKHNETVIGSGDDEIIGNLDNYIVLQLDFEL
jgi:hypothetical protein